MKLEDHLPVEHHLDAIDQRVAALTRVSPLKFGTVTRSR